MLSRPPFVQPRLTNCARVCARFIAVVSLTPRIRARARARTRALVSSRARAHAGTADAGHDPIDTHDISRSNRILICNPLVVSE